MKSTVLSDGHVSSAAKDAEKILLKHLQSFRKNDLDTLMSDYTDESIMITHEATYRGIREISIFFRDLMVHFPKSNTDFQLDKFEVFDDLAFIVWHATTPSLEVPLGTDTFVIEGGKILKQTFAGQLNFLS